ncbi:MAG: serine hydrolase [Ignavibacteria bacterium]|jgi:CubicO group peptidase (beta-lactamase class C family)|nr:serine hydrolase [Ignavibacteria bacterium]MCU7500759.1 serine hydrolase [Ignavibacteria bacterium]MCU7513080.1 serine hydrolase [Ignavibacteria bacterium]MCU7522749.1 serine hydrolase [Ignavibacteria bacterium]
MRNKLLMPILVLILFVNVTAQEKLPAFISDSLDAYVERALKSWDIPGVSVCVVKDGKVVVMKGYGVREAGKNDKVDENTLFLIGSNTKAFTGTALAMLEDEGKCSLSDKVQKYLPDFKMKDPWVAGHLNLSDIVSHRIGMETFQGDFMYWDANLTPQEVIEKFGMLTPKYDFRTRWGYTNAGFVIAGECIRKISGGDWASFIRNKIFSPLKMNSSLALLGEIPQAKNIAKSHTLVDGKLMVIPYPSVDHLAPAGSISSSASDMSHWLIAQLDSGRYDGSQVIPFSAIKKTRQPLSIVGRASNPFDKNPFGLYGMGWSIEDYKGHEIVSHTGGVDGFVTSVTLLPGDKLGIVVLTNNDNNGFYTSLKWEIIDAFLGMPYRNYDKLYLGVYGKRQQTYDEELKALRDTVSMNLKPAADLDAFTGKYMNEVYGYLNIAREGNTLVMTFEHHPTLKGKLESLGGSRFLCTYSDPVFGIRVLPFTVEGSKVKSMTLKVADFVEMTTYDFVKQ